MCLCTKAQGPSRTEYRSLSVNRRARNGSNGTRADCQRQSWIVNDNQFRHAIAFPQVLDGGKLTLNIGLWKDRILEAPHHCQATWRFESGVKAQRAACILVERSRDRRPAQR